MVKEKGRPQRPRLVSKGLCAYQLKQASYAPDDQMLL